MVVAFCEIIIDVEKNPKFSFDFFFGGGGGGGALVVSVVM